MAVHTYVGARYVPRFMGTYDATQIYEALDVVDNGSGTSYIAKKMVSPGTPLTDTDHWALYGASSGAIVQLQNDMIQAQNDIIDAQNDILALDARVDNLEDPPRRFITITDSYGEYPTIAESWPNVFESLLPAGTDCFKLHEGSMGISRPGGHGHNVEGLLTSESANITDHDTITDIIIGLGVNDYDQTTADVIAAYASLHTYIASEYPKATVHLAYASYKGNFDSNKKFHYVELMGVMQDACDKYENWHFCGGVQYIMHYGPYKQSDNSHPNADGSEAIANAIFYSVMGNRDYHFFRMFEGTYSVNGGSTSPYHLTIDDNVFTIRFTGASGVGSVTIPTGVAFINIGSLTEVPVYNGIVSSVAHIKGGSGGTIPDTVEIINSGTDLKARFDLSSSQTVASLRMESFIITGETLLV